MKVEVKENEVKASIKYPYLGINKESDLIVLFTRKVCGVVVKSDENNYLGHYAENWHEVIFTPFNGTITLSND
jgi:hypothetical protein